MSALIIKENSLTVLHNGEVYNINRSHANWDDIYAAAKEQDFDTIVELYYVATTITNQGSGRILVENGTVYYEGTEVHNSLTRRIIQMLSEGFDINPMCAFLDNLMENPSMTSREELYTFLDQNDLPITEDGHFMAYKNVRSDFKDKHSGRVNYSIGSTVVMPRKDVDDRRDNTCSYGLHFCSLEYLKGMWGTSGRNLAVKINPKDVVSIPSDYNNSKGRTCQMEVLSEIVPAYSSSLRGGTVLKLTPKGATIGHKEYIQEYDSFSRQFFFTGEKRLSKDSRASEWIILLKEVEPEEDDNSFFNV